MHLKMNTKHNFFYKIFQSLSILTLCCVSIFVISGCSKNDDMELNKGNNVLALSVDKPEALLQEKDKNNDALKLSWTSGSNGGTNAGISYTLLIDHQGNNFATPFTQELGKGQTERKFFVVELNELLISTFGFQPGEEALMESKVVTTVLGHPELSETSNVISFKITGYKPVSTLLYLIGDATPNGWSADNATEMTPDADLPGVFSWQGKMNNGNFKMITSLGNFLPSYNKGGSETQIVYRTQDAEPDEQFKIEEAGIYIVTVDLLNLTINLKKTSLPTFDRLWIVGDATPNGWNIDAPNELSVDPSNLFLFSYNEILNAGEFKFPTTTGNWGTDFFMPLVNNQDLSETGLQLVSGGSPDFKWKIVNPGPYKIKLDLLETKIYIEPFVPYTEMWMVGDASPVGWNIDAPHPLTPTSGNPYEFTYTGPLAAGEFKFPVKTGDWGCDYFMPLINGQGVESTKMKFVKKGDPDYKWKIAEAGNYKIVMNQLYETISIEKM